MYHLVDPSLFMLVHGRTPVLSEGGHISMPDGCLTYPTKMSDTVIMPTSKHPMDVFQESMPAHSGRFSLEGRLKDSTLQPFFRWSNRFQWLPCEVEFTRQESSSTEVRITSYINNLHPKNRQAYATIEKLISLSVEPWNSVLIKDTTSRYPLRIKTYGFEQSDINDRYKPIKPSHYECTLPDGRWTNETWDRYIVRVQEYLALPEPGSKFEIVDDDPSEPEEPEDLLGAMNLEKLSWPSAEALRELLEFKWGRLHTFIYPQAGISYSYEDWKKGKTAYSIIEKSKSRSAASAPNGLSGDHMYQTIYLPAR